MAVVPVHNNAGQVRELIDRLMNVPDLQVLFVEDAGKDQTAEILRKCQEPRVATLFMARNVGQHRAILTGLQAVRCDRLVVLDGDLQDPPELIPQLLEKLEQSEIVFAQRRSLESLTSRAFKGVFRLASWGRFPSGVGTFLALGPRAIDTLRVFKHRDPYIVGRLALSGLSVSTVPVARQARPGGGSSYNLKRRISLGLRALVGSGLIPIAPFWPTPKVEVAEARGWIEDEVKWVKATPPS